MGRERLFPEAAPPVATVEKSEGEVRCDGRPLRAGAALGQGDRVEAAGGARVVVGLPSGERIELRGPASLEMVRLRRAAASELWLHRGALRVAVAEGARRASPIVYTPEATAAGLAASFEVAATDGVTALRVGRGRVRVDGIHRTSALVGAAQRLDLRRGDGQPPGQPQPDLAALGDLLEAP
jgi:ferric-dicitrate binding protein FerR (iron transport regulator)